MARRNGKNGSVPIPAPNGDAFRAFVVQELLASREHWKEQHRFNREILGLVHNLSSTVNQHSRILTRLSGTVAALAESVSDLNKRMDRQDRINRLTLREFKRLRRHRR